MYEANEIKDVFFSICSNFASCLEVRDNVQTTVVCSPGMDYILATWSNRPVASVVVLLPFIGGFSRSLNTASRDMVARGAVVIAAAGNQRDDACLYSPASEPEVTQTAEGLSSNHAHTGLVFETSVLHLQVITVGAVNSANQLMSLGAGGTNFGRCVDLFAPGDDIVSASSDCPTCFAPCSGTSQAAAHAAGMREQRCEQAPKHPRKAAGDAVVSPACIFAGIAAVILSSKRSMSPVQLLQTMLRYSVGNTINFLPLSEAHRLVTPNLVATVSAGGGDGKGWWTMVDASGK